MESHEFLKYHIFKLINAVLLKLERTTVDLNAYCNIIIKNFMLVQVQYVQVDPLKMYLQIQCISTFKATLWQVS